MTTLKKNVFCENAPKLKSVFYLKNVEEQINKRFKSYRSIFKECGKEEQANGVILFDVLKEKVRITNLNDFYRGYKKSLPVLWEYFCFDDNAADICSSVVSTENKDCKDSDGKEDGEICFHCQ